MDNIPLLYKYIKTWKEDTQPLYDDAFIISHLQDLKLWNRTTVHDAVIAYNPIKHKLTQQPLQRYRKF